jgi:hypothetical protein
VDNVINWSFWRRLKYALNSEVSCEIKMPTTASYVFDAFLPHPKLSDPIIYIYERENTG